MERARPGLVGRLAVGRPLLIGVVFALGLTTLAMAGLTRPYVGPHPEILARFAIAALLIIAAPALAAAGAPRGGRARILLLAAFVAAIVGLHFTGRHYLDPQAAYPLLDLSALVAALALATWLVALRPAIGGNLRLAAAAPYVAILAVFAALGHVALQNGLTETGLAPAVAAALGLSLGLSMTVAVDVAAGFADLFVKGADRARAAAGAAHQAIAPATFAVLCAGSAFLAQYFFPAAHEVGLMTVWIAFAAATLGCGAALFVVSGSLALIVVNEKTAVNENRRRSDIRRVWRPMRRMLPATSAYAATGLVVIGAVLAVFEAERSLTPAVAVFIGGAAAASLLTFVSLRTTILIVSLVTFSHLLATLLYTLTGAPAPDAGQSLPALALAAVAFAQFGLAWRDNAHPRLNAREVAEAAVIQAAGRIFPTLGFGAAAFLVAALSGLWSDGAVASGHFAVTTGLGLVIAPALITAMSARYGYY
ncbi:MAG: hypothetical protein ACE5FO_11495 [Parvularculaceae bacterium]